MKKVLILLITNLILVTLQNSFFVEFFGTSYNPNLVISFTFMFIFMGSDENAILNIFIGALIMDLLGSKIVGISSFSLMLILYGSILFRKAVFKGVIVQFFFILLSVLTYKAVSHLAFDFTLSSLLISSLLTFIIAYFLFLILKSFRQRYKSFEYRIRA